MNSEHLEILKKGANYLRDYRRARNNIALDLSGADLSKCDLSGCNLNNCNLTAANLDGSVLSGTDFTQAILAFKFVHLAVLFIILRRLSQPVLRWAWIAALVMFEVVLGVSGFFAGA